MHTDPDDYVTIVEDKMFGGIISLILIELISLILILKRAGIIFSDTNKQRPKNKPKNKNKSRKKRESLLKKLLEEARLFKLEIPKDIQNIAPENLERIQELLRDRKKLWMKYEALERRAQSIGWNHYYQSQSRTEYNYTQQEKIIVVQESLFERFVSYQKTGMLMEWNIPQPVMPMSERDLTTIEQQLYFYQRWDTEFKIYNKWLPFFLKIFLPPKPYTEKDLVNKISLLKERKKHFVRFMYGFVMFFLVLLGFFYM